MSMHKFVIVAILVTACVVCSSTGCLPPAKGQPYTGPLPTEVHLDMSGTFRFTPDGELRLALANACTLEVRGKQRIKDVICPSGVLETIAVIARTPWDSEIRGTWTDASHLSFQADWKQAKLDPLADDAPSLAARPWSISGAQWRPTADESALILARIGDATGTEVALVQGGPAPNLEVTSFEIQGDVFHAGTPGALLVKIANRGSGIAYRVVATTRSSIDGLHGHRLSFGAIKPGADKTRSIELTVPVTEAARDTMLVLAVTEGNGHAPPNVSQRVVIAPFLGAPVLSMRCGVADRDVTRPDLDAGKPVILRCNVNNAGNAAAQQVELEVTVGGSVAGRSAPKSIAMSARVALDVLVTVPRTLPIDALVEMAITARDRPSGRTARAAVVGVVRRPKLCMPGQLTRAEYQDKVADLRTALSAKALTQAEFDRYDAELVSCLK
jgi:hypothetical protein